MTRDAYLKFFDDVMGPVEGLFRVVEPARVEEVVCAVKRDLEVFRWRLIRLEGG